MTVQRLFLSCLIALGFSLLPHSLAAKPLSAAEKTVCNSLRHCMDIVSRHGPESYDYRVLGEEFVRLGAKGRTALLKMMTSKNAEKALRAQQLLVNPNFRFTPDDQRLIASHWPKGDPQTLRPIMTRLYSPLMRRAALSTVSHPNHPLQNLSTFSTLIRKKKRNPLSNARCKTRTQRSFKPPILR